MRKIVITLKIVQIEEKSYFFPLFSSGKGKAVWTTCPDCVFRAWTTFMYHLTAIKIGLLKETDSVKKRQKCLFLHTWIKYISRFFASERLLLVRYFIRKRCDFRLRDGQSYVTSVPGVKIFEGKFIWRADIWAHNNEYNKLQSYFLVNADQCLCMHNINWTHVHRLKTFMSDPYRDQLAA